MNATIAIPFENGQIFQHFGKSKAFKIYTIEDGRLTNAEVRETDGVGHDTLGLWLVQQGVDAVICGGIGPGAMGVLAAAGIAAMTGVEGPADDAIASFIDGSLSASASPNCDHHAGECSPCGIGGGCGGCHRCGH
jgi:Uncharacterized conserved protein